MKYSHHVALGEVMGVREDRFESIQIIGLIRAQARSNELWTDCRIFGINKGERE